MENIQSKPEYQAEIELMGTKAKKAAKILANSSSEMRNKALLYGAESLLENKAEILKANALDMNYGQKKNLSKAMLDRLMLNDERIEAMAEGLKQIAALKDPVGDVIASWQRPNGLKIERVRTPLGVIGIIFESRPNVTADAGGLCLKSGNAAILRGGSDSLHSAAMIAKSMQEGLKKAGLPQAAVQLINTRDREAVTAMLKMNDKIDVIVPRGGRRLIEYIQKESQIPLFMHLEGLNNCYIDESAELQKAIDIVTNAKMRRTGICGAAENLIIHQNILKSHLPAIAQKLISLGCEIRGDDEVCALLPEAKKASEADWNTEYLDAILSVKVVKNMDEALAFIDQYSSSHTEAIITEDENRAARFLSEVDSAIVIWNASTQFADGGEFGMGAEIGISTGRIHARGPVGVEQLTTFKYKLYGDGQVRPL